MAFDIDDIILNFDPARPQPRFRKMGLSDDVLVAGAALPQPVPWPAGGAPKASPLPTPPSEADDLTRFNGFDAVVVTWTAAEASAMATLFTPGVPLAEWYEYRHNVESYIPLVTGSKAPFNSQSSEMRRYYHSLGLYFPCAVGAARVLLFKSGLHLDYDGPQIPVRRLMAEIAQAVAPKMFITTGTGGGIGANVKLGDVVVAGTVRFDCRTQFKNEDWANASYTASPLPEGAMSAITPAMVSVNASRIEGARPTPQFFSGSAGAVVTTDFFAFDDSTNYYRLQGLGQACDMGDAMVADALRSFPNLAWYSIRNASDPQIPNPSDDIQAATKQAGQIYTRYGGLTTAASLLATWAILRTVPAPGAENGNGFKLGRLPRVSQIGATAKDRKEKEEAMSKTQSSTKTYKLGRLRRTYDPRIPHLSALLAGQAPSTPPPSANYTNGMPANLGMMLNNTLGDCTCAAFYHAIQVWTFNTGQENIDTEPDSDVEKLYILACGYNPSVPGEGPGGNEQHVLTYILKHGAPVGPQGKSVHKIAAFVEVDPRNLNDVKQTIFDCGVAYIGFNVPQYIVPGATPPPAVWDVENQNTQIVGGHAVVLAGYNAQGARVISWGQYYTMTWAFFSKYVDEVYAIADNDWITAKGTSPAGFTLAQLEAQMKALKAE
jgi:Phosphorylase superfamily